LICNPNLYWISWRLSCPSYDLVVTQFFNQRANVWRRRHHEICGLQVSMAGTRHRLSPHCVKQPSLDQFCYNQHHIRNLFQQEPDGCKLFDKCRLSRRFACWFVWHIFHAEARFEVSTNSTRTINCFRIETMYPFNSRGAVLVAQGLTFVGGLIRFLGTAPFIVPFDESETEPLEFQYWICVVAQLLIGAANPIICALPTTVSLHAWFFSV
jgi:hypothetical protein